MEFIPYRTTSGMFDADSETKQMLLHAEKYNFSDIHLQTNMRPQIDIEGCKYDLIDKKLTQTEMIDIINTLYRSKAAADLIAKGTPIDSSYDMRNGRTERYRYRYNGTGELSFGGVDGMQITIRRLPSNPPTAEQLGMKQEDIDDFIYDNGVVIISGQTGSGKTSTLAAVIRYILGNISDTKIITAEAPIEFVFDDVERARTMITQSEVGRHVPSFADALRAALRRKPEIFMVGEMRDLETIDAGLEAAITGHLVLSTNHANGVATTIQRMVMGYPYDIQSNKLFTLCSVMRCCISQTLAKTVDGKRVALREKLVFTPEVVEELTSKPPIELLASSRRILIECGRPMIVDAQEKYEQGIISDAELNKIARNYGDSVR